ncbi:hypothetical protein B0H11DRAFT_1931209 [Mycena galericulata]|nr:hypothetical protein B0H11DRAFT_1931209 [Mycena galericulata]
MYHEVLNLNQQSKEVGIDYCIWSVGSLHKRQKILASKTPLGLVATNELLRAHLCYPTITRALFNLSCSCQNKDVSKVVDVIGVNEPQIFVNINFPETDIRIRANSTATAIHEYEYVYAIRDGQAQIFVIFDTSFIGVKEVTPILFGTGIKFHGQVKDGKNRTRVRVGSKPVRVYSRVFNAPEGRVHGLSTGLKSRPVPVPGLTRGYKPAGVPVTRVLPYMAYSIK